MIINNVHPSFIYSFPHNSHSFISCIPSFLSFFLLLHHTFTLALIYALFSLNSFFLNISPLTFFQSFLLSFRPSVFHFFWHSFCPSFLLQSFDFICPSISSCVHQTFKLYFPFRTSFHSPFYAVFIFRPLHDSNLVLFQDDEGRCFSDSLQELSVMRAGK